MSLLSSLAAGFLKLELLRTLVLTCGVHPNHDDTEAVVSCAFVQVDEFGETRVGPRVWLDPIPIKHGGVPIKNLRAAYLRAVVRLLEPPKLGVSAGLGI